MCTTQSIASKRFSHFEEEVYQVYKNGKKKENYEKTKKGLRYVYSNVIHIDSDSDNSVRNKVSETRKR